MIKVRGRFKALISALTASDFLLGEVNGTVRDHTIAGATSFCGTKKSVVEDVWKKRENRSKAAMIHKGNIGQGSEDI